MKIYHIPSEIKAILFDIDSTLYTNAQYAFEQVDVQIRHFAKIRGIAPDEARKMIADYRNNWAKEHDGAKTSLGNTLVSFGIPIKESIRWRENFIEPEKFLTKDEKLIKTLTLLKQKYKLIAVTNNPVIPAKKTLKVLGIDDLIEQIVGLDTCGVSKPHSAPYAKAAELLGVESKNCVSVGDRFDIDLAVPLKMGMGAILVSGVEEVYFLPKILEN